MSRQIKFCSQCGHKVVAEVPDGDNLTRQVCKHCHTVHYQNPLIVAGCVVEYQGSILLCKRAIEPRSGFWTVPAGFMELGEGLPEAAARETWEEAQARVEISHLSAVVDVIGARQVHIFFEGVMAEPVFGAGDETLETRLLSPADIPWDDIAFLSVRIALEHHLSSRDTGNRSVCLATAPELKFD
jgi:ADP-ribose pyrophosphatase YjhB (NUDIX family)